MQRVLAAGQGILPGHISGNQVCLSYERLREVGRVEISKNLCRCGRIGLGTRYASALLQLPLTMHRLAKPELSHVST